ncbi:hypothetical protein Tsubulata_027530 [Turnera subulata]|uniref:Nudix hydrolase domain-containing protein n=1 Tax=Turnera subulata TaxID=218843 RepID=A0A9Q0J8Y5_9ROSI|nr:hypothetical protein Tsubulata_027530 [Turnera subulata]
MASSLLRFSKGCFNQIPFLHGSLRASTSSLAFKKQAPDKIEHTGLLNAVEDSYAGVTVEMKERIDAKDFIPLLRASISKWRLEGKKGVWVKLPLELSNLVEPVVQEGFKYHHAEPDYLMLVYWIPKTPSTIPENASHRVGIGAFVMNNNGEVLVVKEKSGGFKGTGVWKLPTGVVNEVGLSAFQGEEICAAAVREVKEETGIEADFVEILAFRQSHRSFFRKSDLFFVCMLRPRTYVIHKQESELEAAQWMPIQDYVDQPYNQEHLLFKYVAEICKTKSEKEYLGFSAMPLATTSGKDVILYYNNRDFSKL